MAHVSLLARESADILRALADHRRTGAFIPVVEGGRVVRFSSRRTVERRSIPDPLPVADYIGGMEALGYSFSIEDQDGTPVVFTGMPEMPIPATWNGYALRLQAAVDPGTRGEEIVAFLMGPAGPIDRLDAKQLAAVHRVCEYDPDMVPVFIGGALYAWNGTSDHCPTPSAGISVREFVLNMEAIGATFELVAYTDVMCLLMSVSIPSTNPLWRQRERELCDAFQVAAEGKTREIITFLVDRGDTPHKTGLSYPQAKPQGGRA